MISKSLHTTSSSAKGGQEVLKFTTVNKTYDLQYFAENARKTQNSTLARLLGLGYYR
jgi:hypothetical protein